MALVQFVFLANWNVLGSCCRDLGAHFKHLDGKLYERLLWDSIDLGGDQTNLGKAFAETRNVDDDGGSDERVDDEEAPAEHQAGFNYLISYCVGEPQPSAGEDTC